MYTLDVSSSGSILLLQEFCPCFKTSWSLHAFSFRVSKFSKALSLSQHFKFLLFALSATLFFLRQKGTPLVPFWFSIKRANYEYYYYSLIHTCIENKKYIFQKPVYSTAMFEINISNKAFSPCSQTETSIKLDDFYEMFLSVKKKKGPVCDINCRGSKSVTKRMISY